MTVWEGLNNAQTYYSDIDTDKISLTKKEEVAEANPDALFADGFDEAIIGYEATGACAVYDYNKCLKVLMERDDMTYPEAHEHMEFNVVSAYVGDFTPSFVHIYE